MTCSRLFLLGNLGSLFSGLREANCDRLLPALHRLFAFSAMELALLLFVHRMLHFVLRLLAVFRHGVAHFRVGMEIANSVAGQAARCTLRAAHLMKSID
jgi:hypothetical protein